MSHIWEWIKMHDLPNWFSIIISLVLWPIVLILWKNRTVPSIRNLQIIIREAGGWVAGQECKYLCLDFQNNTGQIVYIANAVIQATALIKGHEQADQDVPTKNYTLKFATKPNEAFEKLQVTVDTGQRVSAGLPVAHNHDESLSTLIKEIKFYNRRWWSWTKYFVLRFDAMVGKDLYRVKFRL